LPILAWVAGKRLLSTSEKHSTRRIVLPTADVLFATYAGQPEPTADDQLVVDALRRRGVVARGTPWDGEDVNWAASRMTVLRSTWDYHLRYEEFLHWLDRVAACTALRNEPALVRWNSHKGYLEQLAERGVRVIDTVFAEAGDLVDLDALARRHRWTDVVVKPAVSASAYETRHYAPSEREAAQGHLERLLLGGDAILQPHVATLAERGELSLLFIDGRFTHAVRRRSALTSVAAMPKSAATEAPRGAVRAGEQVLRETLGAAGVTGPPLYARVDLAEEGDGYLLLEAELVEPSLFFRHAPAAAEQMAAAIVRRL
jgi:hypothetical protein